jgi:predicted ATPase/class 3 adenylate cyclase
VETLTFLFTDIEGSTVLLGRLGDDAYARVLAGHHAVIRSALAAFQGTEVDTQGDAFFAVFPSPRACVAAVLQAQRAMETHAWPGGERVRVRMGIHCGEASRTATGVVGLEVHRAARVAAVGHGGQVLVSEAAAVLVRDGLPPGAALADLGMHRLKDLGRPERIFQLHAAGLSAQFPPLRSLGNPALLNNLPGQLSSFIGRDREICEVRVLVGSSRLVTLTGAGGAGKTRLGLQVAAELLDGSGDGVWLVELAALTDQDAAPAAICQALGIAAQPGRPALDTVVDALGPQDVLIVLDNCEHLIGGCAKTADAIVRRCPRVHLLATSREPLGIGGEIIYRVPPLSLPGPGETGPAAAGSCDAVALFLERAQAQGAAVPLDGQTAPLLVSICQRLDGLPLAIELAAARLRSMSLRSLHDRLDQRFRLLTGGSRTSMQRQQTLRATVEWSYSLLNSAEQLVLGRLSVFAEGFDLDAAEAVCGLGDIEPFDVAGLLGSLVDKSLVVAEAAGPMVRYRLLETIRQFAAEQLAQAGHGEADAVAAAHCAHYLSVAEAAAPHLTGPDQGKWLARLDADQANLRRAAAHAASAVTGTAQVLRFGAALKRYWRSPTQEEEALALLLPVLDRPEARADPELFETALLTAVRAARWVDAAIAPRLGDQAVRLARQLGDGRLLTQALAAVSTACYLAGEDQRRLPLAREAVQRARQLGDDVLLAETISAYLLGDVLISPADITALFTEGIAAAQRSGDHRLAALLANNAAVYALLAGDTPAARAHMEHAVEAARAMGDEDNFEPINMGWVLRQEHDPDGARTSFQAALRASRRTGHRFFIANASLGLACLAGDDGDWHRAATLHGAAQTALERAGQRQQALEARYRQDSLAQVRAHLGQEQLDRAYAQGVALSPDEALDLASESPTKTDLPA